MLADTGSSIYVVMLFAKVEFAMLFEIGFSIGSICVTVLLASVLEGGPLNSGAESIVGVFVVCCICNIIKYIKQI